MPRRGRRAPPAPRSGRRARRSQTRVAREVFAHAGGELGMRVESCSGRGSTERNLPEAGHRVLYAGDSLPDLGRVAGEFLAERDRDRIHQVRAPRLHDVVELGGLPLERARECFQGRQKVARELAERREVHGGRERRRSTTGPCSRGRSGGRRHLRASRSPRSRSCSSSSPNRSGRRRSGTGRRIRPRRCGLPHRRCGRRARDRGVRGRHSPGRRRP